jgi:hypothetical protein
MIHAGTVNAMCLRLDAGHSDHGDKLQVVWQQLKIFVSLEMPQKCHLSGPSHLTFVVEYSANSETPTTADKSRIPLSVFEGDLKTVDQLIECQDTETREEVIWNRFSRCQDSDPHPVFSCREDSIEIIYESPWRSK